MPLVKLYEITSLWFLNSKCLETRTSVNTDDIDTDNLPCLTYKFKGELTGDGVGGGVTEGIFHNKRIGRSSILKLAFHTYDFHIRHPSSVMLKIRIPAKVMMPFPYVRHPSYDSVLIASRCVFCGRVWPDGRQSIECTGQPRSSSHATRKKGPVSRGNRIYGKWLDVRQMSHVW